MTFAAALPSLIGLAISAAVCALLTWALMPLLARYALARPNARSSHKVPTPQGAGIAVIVATLAAAGLVSGLSGANVPATLFGAAIVIAIVGAVDDIQSIAVLPRLALQAVCVGAVVFAPPTELQIVPQLPLWVERALLVLAGLWFVNLVNFMDGLDWMTVAETVPVTLALVGLGLAGALPASATLLAAALGGAMLGFAPFNRPVAKVFLGDVGSLPVGLLLGWCLVQLALSGHVAAALLLPLYYLADSTLTLLRRMRRREPFWLAHRTHYYQRATDNGYPVGGVIGRVFAVNLALALLGALSVAVHTAIADAILLTIGVALVALLLVLFARPRRATR